MSPRRFTLFTLAATLALVASVYGLAWWLQPLDGDLTRIGGFSERDYGWNQPMREFDPPAATWGGTGYTQPADVLVLGDSFANLQPTRQWQNWLAEETGWHIHTLDLHQADFRKIPASPLYRAAPPALVIWNSIERDLNDESSAGPTSCAPRAAPPPARPLDARRIAVASRQAARPSGWEGVNPGFARTWLYKQVPLVGGHGDSLRLRLLRVDLFSAREADGLLIYRRDLNKRNWKDADLERIRCLFSKLADLFEANGTTRFVTALAPDKSSAYRPWLERPDQLPDSRLAALLEGFPVPDARLDLALVRAIEDGIRDVYMPNDTHWGSAGHAVAAEAMLRMLREQGLAR